jgi:AcrR family transcriptional regulator
MPKIIDSEQYRKELLAKCFDLFAEKGYANVTTRQLSKELGVSTGALYHYFPSKKVLFEQLVEEISLKDVLMLRDSAQKAKTLEEKIAALEQCLIENEDYFVKQAVIWTDFYQHTDIEEILSNPVFEQVDKRYQQIMMTLLGLSEPKLARFIWTLINGVLLEQISTDGMLSFTEQIELLMKMLTAYFEKYSTD